MKLTDSEIRAALDDPDRLAALYNAELLDTGPENIFDRLMRVVCDEMGVPIALMTLIDKDRQHIKSRQGLPQSIGSDAPVQGSICKHVVAEGDTVVIPDMARDLRCPQNILTDLGIGAYLGTPLMKDGHILGAVCAIDTKPRHWSKKEIEVLRKRAEFIGSELYIRSKLKKPLL